MSDECVIIFKDHYVDYSKRQYCLLNTCTVHNLDLEVGYDSLDDIPNYEGRVEDGKKICLKWRLEVKDEKNN